MNNDNRSSIGAYTVMRASNSTAVLVGSAILDTSKFDACFYTMSATAITPGASLAFARLDQSNSLKLNNAGTVYELDDPEEVPESQLYANGGLKGADAWSAFNVAHNQYSKVATLGVFSNKRYLQLYIQGSPGITWTASVHAFADALIVPVIASNAE